MLAKLRSYRPSHATVVAYLALFVALGGSSYAAVALKKNSVKSRNIAKNAVTSPKVRNGALLSRDFKAGQLPGGPQGPKGDTGARGADGIPGHDGADGADGAAGTARAFGISGGCGAAPVVACPVLRANGVAYAIKVANGIYCVGVNNISATNSVAVVSVASVVSNLEVDTAIWRSNNLACQPAEFEVETFSQATKTVRDAAGTGTTTVSGPPQLDSSMQFAIAIL